MCRCLISKQPSANSINRAAFGHHPHVGIVFHHLPGHATSQRHDWCVGRPLFCQFCDRLVAQVVEPKPFQPGLLREPPPKYSARCRSRTKACKLSAFMGTSRCPAAVFDRRIWKCRSNRSTSPHFKFRISALRQVLLTAITAAQSAAMPLGRADATLNRLAGTTSPSKRRLTEGFGRRSYGNRPVDTRQPPTQARIAGRYPFWSAAFEFGSAGKRWGTGGNRKTGAVWGDYLRILTPPRQYQGFHCFRLRQHSGCVSSVPASPGSCAPSVPKCGLTHEGVSGIPGLARGANAGAK